MLGYTGPTSPDPSYPVLGDAAHDGAILREATINACTSFLTWLRSMNGANLGGTIQLRIDLAGVDLTGTNLTGAVVRAPGTYGNRPSARTAVRLEVRCVTVRCVTVRFFKVRSLPILIPSRAGPVGRGTAGPIRVGHARGTSSKGRVRRRLHGLATAASTARRSAGSMSIT